VLVVGLVGIGVPVWSDKSPDDEAAARAGAATFKAYCATCHGEKARGDGPMADQLRFAPADLTRVGRRNRGKFDSERVFRMIDGRQPVKGHGGTDMPVWGDAFLDSREGYDKETVKRRIDELVHYLESIQE
jgi:mono/diheme cytochrome c family protein